MILVHHDEFLAAGGARDHLDVAARHIELVGQQPDQGSVGGSTNCWSGHSGLENALRWWAILDSNQ